MEEQKISVITVSYNQGKYIRENIESVLAQNYTNFEHIIIDAGSTDATLSILKEYPHLNWISEPDRGQSDGLNKGFAKATGQIIVWLNSDDYLLPETFARVARELSTHQVTLARAAQIDAAGNITEEVANSPRSWFDIAKYWIPYAWLAQTSVFFTKELLESVKYPDGKYLREDLYYAMDMDLWLRFAEKTKFSSYIDGVCSHFRIHEEAKTGSDGEAAQRECSRVYRFHQSRKLSPERRFSVVLELREDRSKIEHTLHSLASQQLQGAEVLIADPKQIFSGRELSKLAKEFDSKLALLSIRALNQNSSNILDCCSAAAEQASGLYLLFLEAGDAIAPEFLLTANNYFEYDWVGFLLPLAHDERLQASLTQEGSSGASIVALMTGELFSHKFLCRRVALQDLGGFERSYSSLLAVRLLLCRALLQGWHVISQNNLLIEDQSSYELERQMLSRFRTPLGAKLVTELSKESNRDAFSQFKAEKSLLSTFENEVIQNSIKLLQDFSKNIPPLTTEEEREFVEKNLVLA